jgi:uncharacterized tellurite resistance protein B-like protein
MSNFFSNFINTLFDSQEQQIEHIRLLTYLQNKFPNFSHEQILLIYSVAGLLARIAYNDLEITKSEQLMMERELGSWTKLDEMTTKEIVSIVTQEMKLLAGSENHKYCSPLIDLLSELERYKLLETLFKIAQSDGDVSPAEEQEIRGITQALGLPHRYFTAARAQIKV